MMTVRPVPMAAPVIWAAMNAGADAGAMSA
jgi:hypothetical protein